MTLHSFHAREIDDIISTLDTNLSSGLSNAEVQRRLLRYGPNILEKKKQISVWKILLEQFVSPIIWLLIGAALLALVFGEIPEGIAIIIVIVLNASIGFVMELQAVHSMSELRKMGRAHTKVLREGKVKDIDSIDLVPGDVILLEAGDLVTADARLTSEHNLAVKEAALTGESTQVSKETEKLPEDTVLANRTNSVFKGTVVSRGKGQAVVVTTGNNTELGHISALAQEAKKEATPFDKKLNKLSKKLIWLTLGVTVLIFITGVVKGGDLLIMIKTAIALAVAAIPEGLPVVATITLARGMIRLAKKNAIVKTLESVQTLGETNVILTDKTGTLTENEMHLDMFIFESGTLEMSALEKNLNGQTGVNRSNLELFLKIGTLCNDSTLPRNSQKSAKGDPIEVALLRSTHNTLGDPENIQKECPRVAELPFDEAVKMMGTVNKINGDYLVCVKGATEAVLDKCRKVVDENGIEVALADRKKWLDIVENIAGKGLRVLGFAYRKSEEAPAETEFIHDLVFLGLGAFIDPVREEVKEAILSCKHAGIRVVMVTGDHPETAGNIAQKLGLVDNGREAIKVHGQELGPDFSKNEAQKAHILNTHIFARINPSQKLELVALFQNNNYIVGMTGDGVNDAPALKKADIGIAMGQRGTEAAKEVADIVLKDDSFASIVLAIQQGRIIFKNIRKFVVYLLSCNLSEILVVGSASLLGIPFPLLPLQILFLNMVTDVFPALALGMSEGEEGIMNAPPQKPDEPIISKTIWGSIVIYGLCMTIAVIGVEYYSLYQMGLSEQQVNNMAFYTLILVQLWNVLNIPQAHISFLKNEVTRNKYVWFSSLLSLAIVIVAWLLPPAKEVLSLTDLAPQSLVIILLFSLLPTVLIQLLKRVFYLIK